MRAFELTNNIDGSWSRGPEFEFDGDKIVNGDYDPRIKVTTDLVIGKRTGEPMGLRSTSSGDVIFDGNKTNTGFGSTWPNGRGHSLQNTWSNCCY